MSNTSKAEEEQDFTGYADKEPTELQERFTAWIPEVTGFDPNGCKNKSAAFAEGVRLAVSLRMPFQRSPENQELLAERRAAAETKADEPAAPAKKTAAPAKKAAAAKKAAPAAAEEPPRRRGRPAKVAKAAAPVESEPESEPAEEATEPEAVTPHRARGRGRPARRSRASAEAPF